MKGSRDRHWRNGEQKVEPIAKSGKGNPVSKGKQDCGGKIKRKNHLTKFHEGGTNLQRSSLRNAGQETGREGTRGIGGTCRGKEAAHILAGGEEGGGVRLNDAP